MLTHTDLKKGARIIVDGEPYEILESSPMKVAQRKAVIQTKIKNLVSGSVFERNFHQGDVFEEAEMGKIDVKFLYGHRGKFVFSEITDPKNRFELSEEQIGRNAQFLKPNSTVTGIIFGGKMINIVLPIKVQLRVVQSPPGVRGERAQAGTKIVEVETGAKINAPLFIEEGDVIEINTETGEYSKRVE